MTWDHTESDEVTDLMVEEADLLGFKIPTYDEVLSAYSDGYVESMVDKMSLYDGPNRRKDDQEESTFDGKDRRVYPPNPRFSRPVNEDPGYSVDAEDEPLSI